MEETKKEEASKLIHLGGSTVLFTEEPLETPALVASFQSELKKAGVSPDDVVSALQETQDEMFKERSDNHERND